MNWLVGLDQAAEPCCPWPGQCNCRPAARRTIRVKVPHHARRPKSRPVYRPTPAPAFAAPASAQAFDLNVSGDNWELVLADLVTQA